MVEQMETEVKEVTTVSKSAQPVQQVVTTKKVIPPVQTEPPQKAFQKKKAIFRTYQVVWYIAGLIEVLLAFRFTLKILGADPNSGFAFLIYSVSDLFALPFSGILRTAVINSSIIEWSTIVAMLVYFVIAIGVVELLQLVKPVKVQEVEQSVDNPT